MAHYRLTLDYDNGTESPGEWGGWRVRSFSNRHVGFINLETINREELQAKCDAGLAFPVNYEKHGSCLWSLATVLPTVIHDFDKVRFAVLVEWSGSPDNLGAKTLDERREDARRFLIVYTQWCNGHVFWFRLERVNQTPCICCGKPGDDEEVCSLGGLYETEDIAAEVKQQLTSGDTLEFTGPCASVMQACQFAPGVVKKRNS